MKKIKLTKNQYTLVDDEDFEYLNQWKWYCLRNKYACRTITVDVNVRKDLKMHRVIMDCPIDMVVDHIDGDGLNNQKSNLRITTQKLNMANQSGHKDRKCKFKGLKKSRNGFDAQIGFNGEVHSLGSYKDEEVAAYVYNLKAIEFFGEYARLNDTRKFSKEQIEENKLKRITNNKYTGVYYQKKSQRWRSYCTINKKEIYIGTFDTEEEAYIKRKEYLEKHQSN